MARQREPELIVATREDLERLASLSHVAKLSYREWADPRWEPPSLSAELRRSEHRLLDPSGRTLIASDWNLVVGAIHFRDARTDDGRGKAIPCRAHVSGLFVLPARWCEGIGSTLLTAAIDEMRRRDHQEAQLFTAVANERSRNFYERRGWQCSASDTHRHDGLWLARYARSVATSGYRKSG